MGKIFDYIIVNGYTSTGSSAAIDLLKECRGTFTPDVEFRFIKDPHGIMDLDRALNEPTDLLNQDIAIRDFRKFMVQYTRDGGKFHPYGLSYCKFFGKNVLPLTDEYIKSLTTHQYTGYWWYLESYKPYPLYLIHKLLKKSRIYDVRKHSSMRMYGKSDEEFVQSTRKYINDIFVSLTEERGVNPNKIILDQAVPPTWPGYAERCFSSAKVIVVERDPRDVYIDLITEEKIYGDIVGHVGFDVAQTHNVPLFVDWYSGYRHLAVNNGDPKNYMKIWFEDLILNYDETVKSILNFVGMTEEDHVDKGKYLKIERSSKNVGLWHTYEYPEEIRVIEQSLSDYLYHGLD